MRTQIRRDCFACGKTGECTALKVALCRTGPCPFYKTKLQAKAARDRAYWVALGKGYYAGGDQYTPQHGGRER